MILCCLQGLSQEEAARRLGCSAGAVKGRLERGRNQLRLRLAKRGLMLPAVLAGSLLLARSARAVPPDAGGMAEAYVARDRDTGQTVFLKRVRRASADDAALERDMRIYEKLMRMSTTHVLQVLDFIRDDEYVALVTEFADGGDLQTHVEARGNGRGLAVAEAKAIALSVAAAVRELHDRGIVHRDLKPGNVLCRAGSWKLADFGISKNLSRIMTQKTFQQYGTRGYAPPEQFQGVEAHPSADVYSLGKILVFLLTGQTDVDHVPFSAWYDLITRCIRQDPTPRPPVAAVIEELSSIPR